MAGEVGEDSAGGDEAELELDTIIVLGDEILSERELDNPTRFVTVIDVRESPGRVDTVADVLQETVGVRINRWGGMGSYATVSIRGSSASQVQVYIDGVPMNRAVTGVTNLEDLPLDNVAYIEVFRGFTPADFGSSGIGGAINLVTRKGTDKSFCASASFGTYQTYKAELIGSGPLSKGKGTLLVFIGATGGKGDFKYENDNGTPANGHDDFTDTRENNEFKALDLTARMAFDPGSWELALVGSVHDKSLGLPGLGTAPARETGLDTRRYTATASARNRNLAGGKLDLTIAADWLQDNQTYKDPDGELGSGGPRENENRMSTAGARVKAAWLSPDPGAILTAFAEYREETYIPVEHLPKDREGDRERRTLFTYVLQAEVSDPAGVFTLQTTLRREHYWNEIQGDPLFAGSPVAGDNRDDLEFTSPAVGFMARASESLVFKANAGRYYRVPTFYELFGDRGVSIGNTDLKPEKGVNWDAGFVYRGFDRGFWRRPYLEYAFFQSEVEDLIIFFQNSQRTIKPINIGRAVISGHEVAFGLGLGESLGVSGNYTFQAPVDKGDVPHWRDNQLPHRAMHEAFFKLDYRPLPTLKAWTEFTYVSGNYWDRANLYEVADRHIYNAGITADLYRRDGRVVSVTVEGKNIADERISDVAGYPLPGASYYVTVLGKW